MLPPVDYRVDLRDRASHVYRVTARFPLDGVKLDEDAVLLELPGVDARLYLVREYARHVQDLEVEDDRGGALAVSKVGKAAWRVEPAGARWIVARYGVYAHEVTVRTSHLDASHAYWNGATVCLYLEALRHRPARVRIDSVPAGWSIATALPLDTTAPSGSSDGSARLARDYDQIVDSPVEVGAHEPLRFVAGGRAHEVAIWGRAAVNRERFATDLAAIIEEQRKVFGDVPYERYTFIVHVVPGGYGGLEHLDSTTLLTTPQAFTSEKRYQELLELASHEFFHLWNGKRIRPAALGPFDYRRENHTRSLWVVEGWTSYYDRMFLRRARRMTAARWLEKFGEDLTRLARVPGRRRQSLEESSFDAWIKLYRPDENTVNTTVSYYLKGSVVAALLDLEIRGRSDGQRSLDDVLRLLWARYLEDGRGYADEEVQGCVERATGLSLDDFFAHAVRSRGELDLDATLARVGLRARASNGASDGNDDLVWLGATVAGAGGKLRVTETYEDGPAHAGHVYAGDELIAWDGYRIDEEGLRERLAAARPDEVVRLALFRRDQLHEIELTLTRRPRDKIDVVPVENATPEASAALAAWLGDD